MKQRDKGIIMLESNGGKRILRPVRRTAAYEDHALDGYAILYQAYRNSRADEAPGMPATFEDFIAIYRMAQGACS